MNVYSNVQHGVAYEIHEIGGKEIKFIEILATLAAFEMKNKDKEKVTMKLEGEVDNLKMANEQQVVHIVDGFNLVVKMKDDEISRMDCENVELRKAISALEDQLVNREVHVVTQTFQCMNEEGALWVGRAGGHDDHNVQEDSQSDAYLTNVGGHVGGTPKMQDIVLGSIILDHAELQLVGTNNSKGVREASQQNSLVRNIKNKVRREQKLSEFEYATMRKVVTSLSDRQNDKPADDIGCSIKRVVNDDIIDVDATVPFGKKQSGFDINRWVGVWKMMTVHKKEKISNVYTQHNDKYGCATISKLVNVIQKHAFCDATNVFLVGL